jgi:hypothetical protein
MICLASIASFIGCATAKVEHRQIVQNTANLATQKITLPDSTLMRKPIRKGQWVTLLVESLGRDNDLTLRTIKIIDVEGEQVKIEIDSQSALNEGKMSTDGLVIDNYPINPIFEYTRRQLQSAINGMKFRRIIEKAPEKEQADWSQEFLMFNQRMLSKIFMSGYVPFDAKLEPTPCTSGSIESKRCYMFPHKVEMLDYSSAGRTHAHSEIPIIGFVHASDENNSYKVIAFGEDGAVARLSY